jgi:hypothetical protein
MGQILDFGRIPSCIYEFKFPFCGRLRQSALAADFSHQPLSKYSQ